MTTVAIAGSTGSIGTQTVDVVRTQPGRFEVVALAAWSSIDRLVEQAVELRPKLVVVAIAAPLGDLSESLIKRDLGIKDMGTLLPGHGGVLDRFDALIFVLPAIWYLARVSDFFLH